MAELVWRNFQASGLTDASGSAGQEVSRPGSAPTMAYVHVADARQLGVACKPAREELLKRLRAFRGRLPADFKFDRDEANAR
ncbi:hypothetical protein ACN2CC_09330 [Mesorhizobium muleiense]|uniref:hypothetical protein n=1 Tax=Mesorhizobium muleiense TaxID=1004279 RepID=UPI003AFAF9EB